MILSKQEIEEELAHKKQILNARIKRRRPLELQEAQRGLNTPPDVLTEISSLTEQILKLEEEIARLEILAVEGQISLIEAEYKVMTAKTWDTPRGMPSIVGEAELELARLKMGLVLEKAKQIEKEVRVGLAEEAFSSLDPNFVRIFKTLLYQRDFSYVGPGDFPDEVTVNDLDSFIDSLRIIGRAIRLDISTALRLFIEILGDFSYLYRSYWHSYGFGFRDKLLSANRVWNYQNDKETFEQFLEGFGKALDKPESDQNAK